MGLAQGKSEMWRVASPRSVWEVERHPKREEEVKDRGLRNDCFPEDYFLDCWPEDWPALDV